MERHCVRVQMCFNIDEVTNNRVYSVFSALFETISFLNERFPFLGLYINGHDKNYIIVKLVFL